MSEFDESKHPRDKDGKFISNGGQSSNYQQEVNERIKWAQSHNIEVPLYSDGTIDDLKLQKIIQKSQTKIGQLERKKTEAERIAQIQEYTGLSEYEAKLTYEAIDFYTGQGYIAIRNGQKPREEELIEQFIALHPKFDGKIYRGVNLDSDEGEKLLTELKANKSNGTITNMKGISSWSSTKAVAESYGYYRDGEYNFLFEMDNKSGVGIANLSQYEEEAEVLQSKTAKYIVKDIISIENEDTKNRYKIILEESE